MLRPGLFGVRVLRPGLFDVQVLRPGLFGVPVLRPGLFGELVVRLNSADGRRQLRIVADPLPVFLSHHAVFFAAVDQVNGLLLSPPPQ